MDFKAKLKFYRLQQKLTQESVASILHVSRKTVSGWENGRSFPDINEIVELCDIFNISTDQLLRDEGVLSHYAREQIQANTGTRLLKVAYVLNAFLLVVCFFHRFEIGHFNAPWIPWILTINIVFLVIHYNYWEKFKVKSYLSKFLISSVLLVILNSLLESLNRNFMIDIHTSDFSYLLGAAIGETLLVFFMTASLILLLFLNPWLDRRLQINNQQIEVHRTKQLL